jgi:DNA primase
MATILLLEYPELLDTPINSHWEIHPLDADDLRLIQLIELIKSHQLRSFHSIIGFWGGLYGVDSQKELTALVVDQFLGSVTRTSPFNAQQELEGACARLREAASNRRQQDELAQLQAIGFEALTAEQKNRLGELVKARSQNRQKTD